MIDWSRSSPSALGRRLMVRLVKGAYWDTEVKRAQERGLADYPVFTRKAMTDLYYLACAERLLRLRPAPLPAVRHPQRAHRRGDPRDGRRRRGLRVPAPARHGRGALRGGASSDIRSVACRIYAPVGGHHDLLAYLVRRLLENGANSSFVLARRGRQRAGRRAAARPAASIGGPRRARHPGCRCRATSIGRSGANSRGVEFGHRAGAARRCCAEIGEARRTARRVRRPRRCRRRARRRLERVRSSAPTDGATVVGQVGGGGRLEVADRAMAAAARRLPGLGRARRRTERAAALRACRRPARGAPRPR